MQAPVPGPRAKPATLSDAWWLAGLVLPMLIYAARAVHIIASPDISYDTLHTYLPLARAFLADPAAYFSLPASVSVAPGAVVFMALWGADPVAIKSANLFFGLLSIVLASDAARRWAGPAAGAAAAWVFALSPVLVSTGITVLGEAPFIFLVGAWLWACVYATQGLLHSPVRRNAAVVLGGLCLAAATLTRATWLYWLAFACLAGAASVLCTQGHMRIVWMRLTLVHLIALLLVGTFVAGQAERFDRPLIATGSGAALYFGSNTMLHGYEPPFFGLGHDEFTVSDNLGHLSLEGDQRLSAVARVALLQTPVPALLQMYAQKLGAVLFFSRAHLGRHLVNERAVRIALWVLALVTFVLGHRQPLVWMLAVAMAYQCAVHTAVMYNPRYSASALEPLLALSAAAGFGFLWRQPSQRRRRAFAAVALATVAGIGLGVWHQRASAPVMPDLAAGPTRLLQTAALAELSVAGSAGHPFQAPALLPDGWLEVTWQPPYLDFSGITVLNLPVPQLQGRCAELLLRYTEPGGAARSERIRLSGWHAPQPIAWGLGAVALADHHGSLQLRFECEPGTVIGFGPMGLFEASIGRAYRAQALGGVSGTAPP